MRGEKDPLVDLPGIGPRMAASLRALGVERPADLVGRDPEEMFRIIREIAPEFSDPCVLYVFRCAVWCAEHPENTDQDRRKWWKWKSCQHPSDDNRTLHISYPSNILKRYTQARQNKKA